MSCIENIFSKHKRKSLHHVPMWRDDDYKNDYDDDDDDDDEKCSSHEQTLREKKSRILIKKGIRKLKDNQSKSLSPSYLLSHPHTQI